MDNKRNTIQRQLIMNALRELNIHATAEQVYKYVAARHPSISKATVYRNLRQKTESGELMDIGIFYGSARYDHNCHKHYHFICDDCKTIFDIDDCFPDISKHITNMNEFKGFDIMGLNLTFNGLCRDCKINS